jgi:hypothetical protein
MLIIDFRRLGVSLPICSAAGGGVGGGGGGGVGGGHGEETTKPGTKRRQPDM